MLAAINWTNFWAGDNGSVKLWISILLAFVVPATVFFLIRNAQPSQRKYIVSAAYFLTGLVYVLYFLWPQPLNRQPHEIPRNFSESVGFMLGDMLPAAADIANIISAFLLGLGVFSVLTIHVGKAKKGGKDAPYSMVLIGCIVLMVCVGYLNYYQKVNAPTGKDFNLKENWTKVQYAWDYLFDGILQQMDATMFSLIAFYILSAAYRAFRIRSIEATVLLATALLVVMNFLGIVAVGWAHIVGANSGFTLEDISRFLQSSFQNSSIRAIDFGVGIGLLAMALRLWLNLEKGMN